MSAGRVVLGPLAAATRRQVGPAAWVMLEALHDVAVAGNEVLVASTTTRRLREHLGIGKDAISRALRVLRTNGLVTLDEQRSDTGRFSHVAYRLHTPAEVLVTRSIRAQINNASTPKRQVDSAACRLSDDVAGATPPALMPIPVGPAASRRRHLGAPVASVQLDLFTTVDAGTNVGSNQRSKGGSRTCISDARNVAAPSSPAAAPGPVEPHPERTDTGSSPC